MATSGIIPKWHRRLRPATSVPCVVQFLCLTCLVACGALSQLSFVPGGVTWSEQPNAKRQVTKRFSQRRQKSPKVHAEKDPRALSAKRTLRIKAAESAKALIEVLDDILDGPFDFYQASSSYHGLATWKRRRGLQSSDWDNPVIARLHARVRDLVLQDELGSRESANVLWSIATLSDRFSIPTELLDALVKSLPDKAEGMNPQALSNCLWACAQLKDVAPDVLEVVPALGAEIIDEANNMVPQALSDCLWASAQLKDVAPDVVEVVPVIAAQIADKARHMVPQALSNCLWACGRLKEVAPDVLEAVPALGAQISDKAKDMVPQALSNSLYACGQLKDDAPEILKIVLPVVVEVSMKVKDMKPQEMANSLQALVPLQKLVPEIARLVADEDGEEDILRSSAARLNTLLPRLRGKDLSIAVPTVVWACAKFGVYSDEFLVSVAQHLGSRNKLSRLPKFNLCALAWSYQVLDAEDDFEDFKDLLKSVATSRGFSEADIESTRFGHLKWDHAQVPSAASWGQ